jgi:hypothetical protein
MPWAARSGAAVIPESLIDHFERKNQALEQVVSVHPETSTLARSARSRARSTPNPHSALSCREVRR